MAKTNLKKRPTAVKRKLQSDKARLVNRVRISRLKTAVKSFKKALEGDKSKIGEHVDLISSLSDKAVKGGCIKRNKGARIKSWARLLANKA